MGLFGGGNSSSSTSNTNTTIDGRIAGAPGGQAVASYGAGNVSLSVLDGGAVAGAIDLAKSGREMASKDFAEVLNAAQANRELASKEFGSVMDSAKWLFEKNTASMQETLKSIGGVYQQARETELSKDVQGSKQLLQVVGFVVVGLVALSAFRKGA